MEVATLNTIKREAAILAARLNFWAYCLAVEPDFYTLNRPHLEKLCVTLNNFYFGLPLDSSGVIYKNLMINMPPQHGKTRTLVNFTDWVLGKNNSERIIAGSYNDEAATDFSKYARDGITRAKMDPDDIVFSDVFPDTKVKRGTASYNKWALEGQHFNYLGAGIGGSVTGKGATIQIADDLVKSAEDALNENYLTRAWTWFSSTFLSRISADAGRLLKIACMTRWHKDDPCGRLLKIEPDEWHIVKMEAFDGENMLCPDFLDYDTYKGIKRLMLEEIFKANYHQEPMDMQGRLYKSLKTYEELPSSFEKIKAYVDTADTGDDYLAAGIYGISNGACYLLDVYYTTEGMEVTEPGLKNRLVKNAVNVCDVESNSGGRGFARNVKRLLKEDGVSSIVVGWFFQSKNKKSRILSESRNVQENIFFPADWKVRWPEFYEHVTNYQKAGKHDHDDAEDMLTGIAERLGRKIAWG